jgi:hypothetical protein
MYFGKGGKVYRHWSFYITCSIKSHKLKETTTTTTTTTTKTVLQKFIRGLPG